MSDEDDFGGLAFGKRYKPDDGCDWTAVIIWEMRSKARIRARINTPRPVPVRKNKVSQNAEKKSAKPKRAKTGRSVTGVAGGNGAAAAEISRKKRAA